MSPNPNASFSPSVVVVSDDAIQCHLLVSLLDHHGKRALGAHSVEHALQVLEEGGPVNAMVIDREILGVFGPRWCAMLDQSPYPVSVRHIPIIAVSSQFGGAETEDLSSWGVKTILPLPIDPKQFLTSLDSVLNEAGAVSGSPRVLIASSAINQEEFLCRILQEQGWFAHVTTTGSEIRQILQELCPDLVLLHLPASDNRGLELVIDIKSHHPGIAVFLATDSSDPSYAVKGLQLGADEIIGSPFSGQYVHALWEKYRRLRGTSSGSGPDPESFRAGGGPNHTSLVRLVGEIAHDINNVLTPILGHAGMLNRQSLGGNALLGSATVIEQATRRAKELTAKLLGEVRPPQERRESVNLSDIVKEVLDLVQPGANHAIHVQLLFQSSDLWVRGDAGMLHQLVLNLIMNACEAMPQGGTLTVETRRTVIGKGDCATHRAVSPGDYLDLIVRDTGCGIPEEVLPHVFEEFFTTKRQGSGIGLATVRDVVRQSGGAVSVESRVAGGAEFHVLLPLVMAHERRRRVTGGPHQPQKHVLVVDDDAAVGQTAGEMLEYLGHTVTVMDNPKAAIDLVGSPTLSIDVVLLDMAMEPMDGLTCFHALRMHHPEIPVLLTSGDDCNPEVQQLVDDGTTGFLQKPYDVQDLIVAMAQMESSLSPPMSQNSLSIPSTVAEEIV